jgi:cytochrome c556
MNLCILNDDNRVSTEGSDQSLFLKEPHHAIVSQNTQQGALDMKLSIQVVLIAAALAATGAYAKGDRTDPNAIARSETMRAIGGAIGALGKMAKGEMPYDATAAQAAKDAVIAAAAATPEAFMTQGDADPASEAKAELWANWDDFALKATALGDAANAMDVSSVETIGAGLGPLGGACKACHTAYRM